MPTCGAEIIGQKTKKKRSMMLLRRQCGHGCLRYNDGDDCDDGDGGGGVWRAALVVAMTVVAMNRLMKFLIFFLFCARARTESENRELIL